MTRHAVYPADFLAWREAQRSFEAFGAYVPIGAEDLTHWARRGLAGAPARPPGDRRALAGARRAAGPRPDLPAGGSVNWTTALPAAAAALALLLMAVTLATAAPIRRALRTEPRDVLSE